MRQLDSTGCNNARNNNAHSTPLLFCCHFLLVFINTTNITVEFVMCIPQRQSSNGSLALRTLNSSTRYR